jgi:hypothetical protein
MLHNLRNWLFVNLTRFNLKFVFFKFLSLCIILPLIAVISQTLVRSIFNDKYAGQVKTYVQSDSNFIENYPFVRDTQVDGWSDCSAIIQGLSVKSKSAFELSQTGSYLGECPKLIELNQKNELNNIQETGVFPQYWHGYLIITKPLIILLGVMNTKLLLNLVLLSLIIILFYRLSENLSLTFLISFLFIFLYSDLPVLFFSLPHISWFIYMFLISLVYERYFSRLYKVLYYFFFISGFANTFFDFGFTPVIGLVFLNLITFLKLTYPLNLNNFIKINVANFIWFTGMLYAILSKMIFYSLDSGFTGSFNFFKKRILDDTVIKVDVGYFDGITSTIRIAISHVDLDLVSLLFLGLIILNVIKFLKLNRFQMLKIFMAALTLSFPMFLYLFVTSDVTYVHSWMHFRNWSWLVCLNLILISGLNYKAIHASGK